MFSLSFDHVYQQFTHGSRFTMSNAVFFSLEKVVFALMDTLINEIKYLKTYDNQIV